MKEIAQKEIRRKESGQKKEHPAKKGRESLAVPFSSGFRIRQTVGCLLVFYMLVLMYFLLFSERYGRIADSGAVYHYNLIPFAEIRRFWTYREQLGSFAFYTNLWGNVAGFFPFGFLLPAVCRGMRSGFLILLSGLTLSLCAEAIQLVTKVGCFDVDDLILNTLGAFLGYLAFVLCSRLRREYYGKKI